MPFGGRCEYVDFKDCVSQNGDKGDPEAYCAVLMRETEGHCASKQTTMNKYIYNTVTAATVRSDTHIAGCTISTVTADREGDRVLPEGGDFANFMKSPVLLWAHGGGDGYASVPIGSVTSIEVTPGQGMKAEWKWLENDPFADRIKNAWNQGVVRASSIGFKPIKYVPNGVGNDIEKWELLELSLCAIPMNPEAVRSLKSMGLLAASEVLMSEEKADKGVLDHQEPDMLSTKQGEEGMGEPMNEDIDSPEVQAMELSMYSAVLASATSTLNGLHPLVTATQDLIAGLTPEILSNHETQEEVAQNICALCDQMCAMIGLVYASAWALKDKDEEPEAYGAVEKPMGIENEGMKPTFAKSMGMKSGRVLSAKNLSRIKAAQQHLTDVMKSLPMEQQPPDSAPNEQGTKSASVLFTLVDDPAPQEPTYRIEKDVLKAVINEAMAASITAPTVEKFQRSLDMARGRVY